MKAIIFYTNTGGGHSSAADAIAEALQSMGVVTKQVDILGVAGEKISNTVSKAYNSAVRNRPDIFGLLYHAGKQTGNSEKKSIIFKLNTLHASKVLKLVEDEKADILICTHLFAGQTVTHLKEKFNLNIVSSAIITDYTFTPLWEETNLDFYFIPHKDLLFKFIEKNLPVEKIIPFGLPVKAAFSKASEKSFIKSKLGYDPDKPHILIAGGSMGAGNIYGTVNYLIEKLRDVQLTVVCGSNEKLKQRIKRISSHKDVKILGNTDMMCELMEASDILVSKPGGLTSTEAMVKGIPFVAITPIPGGETDNCNFFVDRGMASFAETPEKTAELCRVLLKNSDASEQMINAQKRNINANSGYDIASFLIKAVEKR